jgi:hypothetical protein
LLSIVSHHLNLDSKQLRKEQSTPKTMTSYGPNKNVLE